MKQNMNTKDKISEQEQKVRDYWEKTNLFFYDTIIEVENIYCSHDLFCSKEQIDTYIELKERTDKYNINSYSGSTFIEMIKVNHFKEIVNDNDESQCLYIVYFGDCSNGNSISFNIRNRIKDANYSFHPFKKMLPDSTYITGRTNWVMKLVAELKYESKYDDKMYLKNKLIM